MTPIRELIKASSWPAIRSSIPEIESVLLSVLDHIIERYQADPEYGFINTKFSTLTGENFPTSDHPLDLKGKNTVFGWIQGRGLESLAGHYAWLDSCSISTPEENLKRKTVLKGMISSIMEKLERIRNRNHGHLFFMMTPEGMPFEIGESGKRIPVDCNGSPSNFSDLFYSKGLMAAASLLGHTNKTETAKEYFRKVADDLSEQRFRSDQRSFDPKNKIAPVPGKYFEGPEMISIGGYALFARWTQEEEWYEKGQKTIASLISRYLNRGQFPQLEKYDFVEAIDVHGQPWKEEDRILSDPGHALEFVGLACKFLLTLDKVSGKTKKQEDFLQMCRELLPAMFKQNFKNGYHGTGGICKTFDLIRRTPINSDMPWWSLPETIRAAAELSVFCKNEKDAMAEIIRICANAFFKNFLNPKAHCSAFQTLNRFGKPVDIIPATPDADPGYHTGLSLIDFLEILRMK